MKNYSELLRIHQWIKNLFILIPAFFAQKITDWSIADDLVLAFFGFSLTASSVYIINDLKDKEKDKLHPEKSKRPIPSGAISRNTALLFFGLTLVGGIALSYWVSTEFLIWVFSYFILNIFYTLGLKRIPLLDINVIALGFLIRVMSGAAAVNVEVSSWLTIMVFILALFLGLAKRRDDLLLKEENGKELRKSIKGYNMEFINGGLFLLSAIVVVIYILYAKSEEVMRLHHPKMYYSSFFVLLGMMRYLQLAVVENRSGSPTKVLYKDFFTQITLLGWAITVFILIYIL